MDVHFGLSLIFIFAVLAMLLAFLANKPDVFERITIRLIDLFRDLLQWLTRIL